MHHLTEMLTGRANWTVGDRTFTEVVWWGNQEVLHHGAEIGLLRDLYRAAQE